jgi:hypothetical protein
VNLSPAGADAGTHVQVSPLPSSPSHMASRIIAAPSINRYIKIYILKYYWRQPIV